jgi:hypothetical protein
MVSFQCLAGKARALLVILCLGFGVCAASAAPPKNIPDGFSWFRSRLGVGEFFRPNGWYVKEEYKDGTNALFITRESLKTSDHFIAGMTVNQIPQFQIKQNIAPSVFAKVYAARLAKQNKVLLSDVVKGGKFDMNVVRVLGNNNGVSTVLHHIAVGVDSRDVLYLVIFEAPEAEWEKLSETARVMLNFFRLGS